MYTEKERKEFMENIIDKVRSSENIIGTYLIGSITIGFRDIYSDCDFMMAYKSECDPATIQNEVLSFFNKEEIGYIMTRKWSTTIWGVSVYLKNGLSTDISFGPLEKLKASSKQIAVGVDTDGLLQEHLNQALLNLKSVEIDFLNDGWEFMYLIRKIKIALYRDNNLYAYQLLSDARIKLLNIEGCKEKQKMHEFKAYNELNTEFLEKVKVSIPISLEQQEIEKCYKILLEIFWNLSDKWDKNLETLINI